MSVKMTFGLTEENLKVIDKELLEFGSSKYAWERIGKAIGWIGEEAAYWYIRHLQEQLENLNNKNHSTCQPKLQ